MEHKYFTKPDGSAHAFPISYQGPLITADMSPITEEALLASRAPTLNQLKAAKDADINAARLEANFTTFTHAGKVFSCDRLSRSDIDGTNGTMTLTGEFPPNWPGGWKAVDNSYIPITTREQWEAFYLAMCATGAINFAHAQQLKAAVAQATTAEQVAAINW